HRAIAGGQPAGRQLVPEPMLVATAARDVALGKADGEVLGGGIGLVHQAQVDVHLLGGIVPVDLPKPKAFWTVVAVWGLTGAISPYRDPSQTEGTVHQLNLAHGAPPF